MILALTVVAFVAGGLFAYDYIQRAPVREARQKLAEKDYGFALTVLNEYLAQHPSDYIAMSLKGRAHAGLNQFEKCKQVYEQIEGAYEIEDMFAFAKALTVLKSYNEAYNNWIGVMGLVNQGALDHWDPSEKNALHGEALYMMAVCQFQLGQNDRSIQTIDDLLKVDGNELHGRYLKGLVEAKRGNELDAIKQWELVLELDPNITELKIPPYLFFYELGLLKVDQGQSEEGIEMLKQSLTLNTFESIERASECMEAIGTGYEELGNQEQAKFYWEKQIQFQQQYKLQPSVVAREGLANQALIEKDPARAVGYLVALRDAGLVKSSTSYLMQRAMAMQGKDKEAREFQQLTQELREKEVKLNTIREALREKSGTYWAVVVRAHDFASEGNWQQAEQLLASVEEYTNDDFSKRFIKAVAEKGPLPPLTDIPLDVF